MDRDEYESVDVGGEFSGRGIDNGSTLAITGNLLVEPVPGLLFVFVCRFGLRPPLVLGPGSTLKGEYLALNLMGGGPTLGRIGLGA